MENKDFFKRTKLLLGENGFNKLKSSKVAIFGIGGVGSFVVEALVRSGVGNITLIDNDIVDETNINRQIHATVNTIGRIKVEVMKERILSINPEISVTTYQLFYDRSCKEITFDFDYIVDAIDSIPSKLDLCEKAKQENIPIISSMGTANKLDNTKFEISDIYKTSVDPIAKIMRKECKLRRIEKLKVVYSKEEPKKVKDENGKPLLGSVSFVPSVAGLTIAGEVIKDLIRMY